MYKTIGDFIYNVLTKTTVWVGQPIGNYVYGRFDPSVPWSYASPASVIDARWGQGCAAAKGTLVGERYSSTFVTCVVQHPSNPCQLENNTQYQVSDVDHQDIVLTSYPQGEASTSYDAFFIVQYNQLFPENGQDG